MSNPDADGENRLEQLLHRALASDAPLDGSVLPPRADLGTLGPPDGELAQTYEWLLAAADVSDGLDAARDYAAAGLMCIRAGAFTTALECAERAPRAVSMLLRGSVAAHRADVATASPLLERLPTELAELDPEVRLNALWAAAAQGLLWLERWVAASALLVRVPVGVLPLAVRAELELRCGYVAAALVTARKAVAGAGERAIGERMDAAFAYVTLARIEAVRGDEACRESAAEAIYLARDTGAAMVMAHAHAALGLLELGADRPRPAADQLAEGEQLERRLGVRLPTVTQSAGDFVEAHLRAGRRAAAEGVAGRLDGELAWQRSVSARCRGLLAPQRFEPEFHAALEVQLPGEFERARTLLGFGAALRAAGGEEGARSVLARAEVGFKLAGARTWARQAVREERGAREAVTQPLR